MSKVAKRRVVVYYSCGYAHEKPSYKVLGGSLLLFVKEDTKNMCLVLIPVPLKGGVGAEISSQAGEEILDYLDYPIKRNA